MPSRTIAGLAAVLAAAAIAPAAAAGRGAIAVEGWLEPTQPGVPFGGRIVRVDPGTGAATWQRLPADVSSVTPSPDGRLIAFRRGEGPNFFVARTLRAQHPRLVARGTRKVAWSPDGGRLAFARHGAIFETGRGLRASRRLTGRLDASGPLAWSRDGRRIAFVRRAEPRACGGYSVAVVQLRTGAVRTIYPSGSDPEACADASDVAWSPSSRLAVATGHGIVVIGPGGGELHTGGVGGAVKLAWLGRSSLLAYLGFGCALPPQGRCVSTIHADGTDDRALEAFSFRFDMVALGWWP